MELKTENWRYFLRLALPSSRPGFLQEHNHQAIDLEEDCGENDQDAEASEEHHGGLEDAKGCDH